MQRSVNSVMVLDSFGLFGGVFFTSTIRDSRPAVLVAEVLQLALAGFVAHRAVERVVQQQPFERVAPATSSRADAERERLGVARVVGKGRERRGRVCRNRR